jgi:hypothetical protein
MGRPKQFDDSRLLDIMAEMLAWPEYTHVRTQDAAMRQAIAYIPGSDRWPPDKHERVVKRLKKSYAKNGAALEAATRRLPRLYPGPVLPPPLMLMPTDPEAAQAFAETRDLVDGLRFAAEWAAHLAGILDRQRWRPEGVNSDLLAHARKLVRIVRKEAEAEEERATRAEKNPDR